VGVRPAEILTDKSGQMLFVFDSINSKIQVIDVRKSQILSVLARKRPTAGRRGV